jgi:DNA-binding winged helix-turn-helix (wHTH) protein/Flp pilus assembly protein TadD
MPTDDRTILEFNGFRLDPYRRELLDPESRVVPVSGKVFDALVLFVARPGELIDRAALMDALWPHTIVNDNNLNQTITALRRALGSGCIETVKGRGYQFVADVRRIAAGSLGPSASQKPRRAPHRLWLAAVVLVLASAAVLAAIVGYFGSSRPFDLIYRYAEPPAVNADALNLYQSARDLEMNNESLAGLRDARERYQRAIDIEPGFALAHARLALNLLDEYALFSDQDRRLLQLGREAAATALGLDEDLPDARLAMGWYHFHDGNPREALLSFERANASNPGDAETLWMVGMTYTMLGDWEAALARFDVARRVISTYRRVAMSESKAYAQMMLRQYREAERELGDVLALTPKHASALSMLAMIPMLRDGTVDRADEIARNPPDNDDGWLVEPPPYFAFQAALYRRDFDGGLEYLDDWTEPHWENYQWMPRDSAIATLLELSGRREDARSYWESARRVLSAPAESPLAGPAKVVAYAEALAALGEHDAARRQVEQLMGFVEAIAEEGSPGIQFVRMDTALRVYSRTGDAGQAASLLSAYFSRPGWWSPEGLWPDPRLDGLRDDPAFRAAFGRE